MINIAKNEVGGLADDGHANLGDEPVRFLLHGIRARGTQKTTRCGSTWGTGRRTRHAEDRTDGTSPKAEVVPSLPGRGPPAPPVGPLVGPGRVAAAALVEAQEPCSCSAGALLL